MINLDNETIERWLANPDDFAYDFIRYSIICLHALDIDVSFIKGRIAEAHAEWIAICNHWQTHLFERDVESLSYTKILSALLYCLSRQTFVESIASYQNTGRRSDCEFNGTEEEKEEARQDFLGAPEVILAFDFCINILNFYEINRTDRSDKFSPRLTASLRHDMIFFLVNGDGQEALAVYMAIKAIYTRN